MGRLIPLTRSILVASCALFLADAAAAESFPPETAYEREIRPLLQRYCWECHDSKKHKAGLSLEAYADLSSLRQNREVWGEILRKVKSREMPPDGKPQLEENERQTLTTWIQTELFPVDCAHPDPGRVTIRRLNRTEYNNTVRDLLGVDFEPAADFPTDDTGYGFDNIGDVLSVSPLLLEKYLSAAERIVSSPQARSRIFICQPSAGATNECFRAIAGNLARRAFRRLPESAELERLVALCLDAQEGGANFEQAVTLMAQAVLTSPSFLFRGELQPDPENPQVVRPVDEFALAARLSYFLWSSMPDDELFTLAGNGKLRQNLPRQVRRMLHDSKAQALFRSFSGQWLQLRALAQVAPDPVAFPEFNAELRTAMEKETQMLFEHIARRDLSVLEFLTADYTFLNEMLARHYGIPGVSGPDFRRVSLKQTGRTGVLTHASVLTLTSNPTRTSPVKRGKWVLENLLAQPPPPPPPGVPPLPESHADSASASLRQRMEQHRSDPLCSSCHSLMDPIGFGLENYDGIGRWREQDGKFEIDASGRLKTGETFSGPMQLHEILARHKKQEFLRCLSAKMLTFALGRGLEYYDSCSLDKIGAELDANHYRFSALVMAIVQSAPFQMRRGETP